MLDTVPTAEELTNLVGKSLYEIWDSLIALIDESYDTPSGSFYGSSRLSYL